MARQKKAWPDTLGPTPPARDIEITCGWCITGHHDHCKPRSFSLLTNHTYICDCNHEAD